MTPASLGLKGVAAPGTPVQFTADTTIVACRVRVQVVIGHTGKVYLGKSGMDKATYAGVIKEFWPTGVGGGIADAYEWEAGGKEGNPIRLADYYVDANVAAEGLIVSYWVK